jgi:hypothetical protein
MCGLFIALARLPDPRVDGMLLLLPHGHNDQAAKIKEEDRFSIPEEDLLRGGSGTGAWDEGTY